MSTKTVLLSEVIPESKERLYAAWLDSDEHTAFTGDEASIEPFVGGNHSSLGGSATGETLELEPGKRIVQSWRHTDFPDDAPDARLEISFEETLGGTLVTLLHTGLPSGQSERYREGWLRQYLRPMKTFFSSQSTVSTTSDEDDAVYDQEEAVTVVAPSPMAPAPAPPPLPRRSSNGASERRTSGTQRRARPKADRAQPTPPAGKARATAKAKPKANAKAKAGGKSESGARVARRTTAAPARAKRAKPRAAAKSSAKPKRASAKAKRATKKKSAPASKPTRRRTPAGKKPR